MGNSFEVKIEDGQFQKKIRKLARRNGIDEGKFIKEQGALYARDIAKAVPPYASGVLKLTSRTIGTAKDKAQGEWALFNDLRQIFSIQQPAVIKWAKKTFGAGPIFKGKEQTGSGLALTIAEVEAWHRKQTSSRGRTRAMKHANRLWVSEPLLRKYYNKEKSKVGRAKASLAKAMVALDPNQKVPKWISRNFGIALGSGQFMKLSKGPRASINAIGHGLHHAFSKLNFIRSFRLVAMKKRLLFIIRANAKQSGFKVR